VTNVTWDWGEGPTNPTTGPIDTHPYAQAGTYTVQATVTAPGQLAGRGTTSVTIP
jgi:PKD repeat protein